MTKLSKVLTSVPNNFIILDGWLKQHDISNSLKQKYLKAGWLHSLGKGASYRAGDIPNWPNAIAAINQQGMYIHVGGKTALELLGASHFIHENITNLNLYGVSGQYLPQWFVSHDWQTKVQYFQLNFLPPELGIKQFTLEDSTFNISGSERALLELLYLIPKIHSIEEAYYIVENLADIKFLLLQELLENCNSIKVKRLCLYLADRAAHSWLKGLDKTRIKLGSGNRQIVLGGYLDPTYRITIPKSWKEDEASIF